MDRLDDPLSTVRGLTLGVLLSAAIWLAILDVLLFSGHIAV